MRKKIKIAHVVGGLHSGGVEAVIYNYFSHMDMDKFEVHIISNSPSVQECELQFKNLGCKIHVLPERKKQFIRNLKQTISIFKKENFDILHCHMNLNSFYHTFLGKLCHIKIRISHSHLVEFPNGIMKNILYNTKKRLNRIFATHYFACGKSAGKYLFGKNNVDKGKVFILKNAIDVDKFIYNKSIRDKLRKELDIEDLFCIGHIGRFTEQKNHAFLIEIFEQVLKRKKDSVLLLFGTGQKMKTIRQMVHQKNLSSYVRFMGVSNNIEAYYQAMDCFLFPSLYEGLGIVLVEAQASGLPCISSDTVPKEAKISDLVTFHKLSTSAESWAETVCKLDTNKRVLDTRNMITDAEYDIRSAAIILEAWYINHTS